MDQELREPCCPEGGDPNDRLSFVFRGVRLGALINTHSHNPKVQWRAKDKLLIRYFAAKHRLDCISVKTFPLPKLAALMDVVDVALLGSEEWRAIEAKLRSSLVHTLAGLVKSGQLSERYSVEEQRTVQEWPQRLRKAWLDKIHENCDSQGGRGGGGGGVIPREMVPDRGGHRSSQTVHVPVDMRDPIVANQLRPAVSAPALVHSEVPFGAGVGLTTPPHTPPVARWPPNPTRRDLAVYTSILELARAGQYLPAGSCRNAVLIRPPSPSDPVASPQSMAGHAIAIQRRSALRLGPKHPRADPSCDRGQWIQIVADDILRPAQRVPKHCRPRDPDGPDPPRGTRTSSFLGFPPGPGLLLDGGTAGTESPDPSFWNALMASARLSSIHRQLSIDLAEARSKLLARLVDLDDLRARLPFYMFVLQGLAAAAHAGSARQEERRFAQWLRNQQQQRQHASDEGESEVEGELALLTGRVQELRETVEDTAVAASSAPNGPDPVGLGPG
ncbi:hypothetical protein ColLi_13429 [Colletotrichum liriopes]|uniref:Uncharacterized protein n=1 Tax=Colletotrichum liriopes TaxID=708192 RepID=A0AA37H269_9PEZI|nr:hypothetical protein ColLi_13429 [Colletotrichum liriopes]